MSDLPKTAELLLKLGKAAQRAGDLKRQCSHEHIVAEDAIKRAEEAEAALRLVQKHCETAWARGYRMGVASDEERIKGAEAARYRSKQSEAVMNETMTNLLEKAEAERDEWKARHDDIAATLALERRYAKDDRTTLREWKERYEALRKQIEAAK